MAVKPCGAKLDRAMNGSQVVLRRGGVWVQARQGVARQPSSRHNEGSSDLHKESLGRGITLKSTNKPTQRGRATGAHLMPGPKLLRANASESESKRER